MTKLISVLAIMLVPTALFAQHSSQVPESVSAGSHLTASYGRIPLSFEANRGQTGSSVQFLAHGQGYTLYLRQGEAVLALRRATPPIADGGMLANSHQDSVIKEDEIETSVVRVRLVGANSQATVRPEEEQVTKTNYFIGNDPAQWRTDVPNYSRVRYAGIYPGIDLVYYGNQRQLEHDFVVAPGGDPGRIAFVLKGAGRLRIDPASGDLIVSMIAPGSVSGIASWGQSELRLLRPVTYQDTDGLPTHVASSYKLLAGNKIGFTVGKYDHARPLVIDPVLVYSTYLGGSGNATGAGDQGNGIAVDDRGHAYVVGTTYSVDFPLRRHALQAQNEAALAGAGATVFVAKLNERGTELEFSTYLGGSGGEFGYGIALDDSDNAYVTGSTYSKDFPVTCGALQTTNGSLTSGATTAFVAKLDREGHRLEYSTYLGGSGNQASPPQGDVAQAIAVDDRGHAYVTGYTWSADFPVTDAAFQAKFAGSATVSNAFVTKLNRDGSKLAYSTYLGGSGTNGAGDYGNAIALDAAGDAFVTGSASSNNFPVTSGAYQSQNKAAVTNGSTVFVTELNPQGADEVYSTYVGGSGVDSARAIAVDKSGFAYVAGTTASTDFPLTAGVIEGTNNGIGRYFNTGTQFSPYSSGAFVTKLAPGGSVLEYSTNLEGQGTSVNGLAVDRSGTVYLTGSAPTAGAGQFGGFQATPDGLATPASTGNTAFLVKLNPSASALNFSTLLGGSANDGAMALALDREGDVYLTGSASSTDFPTTSGAFQTANDANAVNGNNAFVSKFALAGVANQTVYPPLPANIGTYMTGSAEFGTDIPYCDYWFLGIWVTVYTDAYGPPPTGGISFFTPAVIFLLPDDYPVFGSWGGPSSAVSVNAGPGVFSFGEVDLPWSATYVGDSVYGMSTTTGTAVFPSGCDPNRGFSAAGPTLTPTPKIQVHVQTAPGKGLSASVLSSTPAKSSVSGQKFIPPPGIVPGRGPVSEVMSSDHRERKTGCVAPPERRNDDRWHQREGSHDSDSD